MSKLMSHKRLNHFAGLLALLVAPAVLASGMQLGLAEGQPFLIATKSSLPPGFSSQLPIPSANEPGDGPQDLLVVGQISKSVDNARFVAESTEILVLPTTIVVGGDSQGTSLKVGQHVAVSGDFLGDQFGIARTIVILAEPLVPGATLTYRRHQDASIERTQGDTLESISVAQERGSRDSASLASAVVTSTQASPAWVAGKSGQASVVRGISGSGARARGISGSGLRGISGSGARARGISGSGLRGISGSGARARGISGSGLRGISGSGARLRSASEDSSL
jgi:hypothetical protein